jgi:hypothetical protein
MRSFEGNEPISVELAAQMSIGERLVSGSLSVRSNVFSNGFPVHSKANEGNHLKCFAFPFTSYIKVWPTHLPQPQGMVNRLD